MLKRVVALLVGVMITVNLVANWIYSSALYDLGVSMILEMQRFSSPLLDSLFIFLSMLIDPMLITYITVFFIVLMRRKLTAFITVIFVLLNTYFILISKSFYAAPRPFWTHAAVRNIGYYCPKDYGNPSGHAEFVAVITVFIFEFVDTKKQRRYAFLAAFLMVAVSISRMHLGSHSLDQIIQGLFLGLALSILYVHGGLKELVRDLLIKQRKAAYRVTLIVLIISMHILYIWAYLANNEQAANHKKAAKAWVRNYNQKCGKDIDEHYLSFVMLNLSAVIVNLLTGLVFGYNKMLDSPAALMYMKGEWQLNAKKYPNAVVRYLVYFGVQGLLFGVGFLVFGPIMLVFGKNYVSTFAYFNLAALVSSYIYAGWTLNVLVRLQVVQRAEPGEEQGTAGKLE